MSLVKCEICGSLLSEINWSHLKYSHNLTTSEYQKSFPNAVLVPMELRLTRGASISKDRGEPIRSLTPELLKSLVRGPGAPRGTVHTAEHNAKIGSSVKRWVLGHPEENLERNRKVSKALTGISRDESFSKSCSEGQSKRWARGDERLEYSLRTTQQMLKQWADPSWRDKMIKSLNERWARQTPQEREGFGASISRRYTKRTLEEVRDFSSKMSEVVTKVWANRSPEEVEAIGSSISESVKAVWASWTPAKLEAYRASSSELHRNLWKGLSLDKRNEWIRNIANSNSRGPSSLEVLLRIILGKHFPGEWQYNGNGKASGPVGGRVPDFTRIDGQKYLIELHGCTYHHSLVPEERGSEEETIKHYAKFSYKCLVIWGDELYDTGYIVSKVKELMEVVEWKRDEK